MPFIKINNCNVNGVYGITTFATMIFVVLAVYYMIFSQSRAIVSYDENQDSTEDYSIEIKVRVII